MVISLARILLISRSYFASTVFSGTCLPYTQHCLHILHSFTISLKMRTQAIVAVLFSALAGQVIGQDDPHDAPRVNDNPIGVKYKATLPKEPFFKDAAIDGNVKGFIQAEAPSDGHGVQFKVQFSNLPKEGGPFSNSSTIAQPDCS